MNNILQIQLINSIEKVNIPTLGLYLFVFVGIIFSIIKLSKDNYLKQLFQIVSFDKNKFEAQTAGYNISKSNFFLHISLVILVALSISILTNEYLEGYFIIKNLIGVLVFYVIQLIGFIIISSLISSSEKAFIAHRLSYYELFSLFLFPIALISFYSPINLSVLIIITLIALYSLILIRISVYLSRLISIFHIILYLCTLEIIPILFLLKFIFNY